MKTIQVKINIPEIAPIPFIVFKNDYIGDTITKTGCWEPEVTRFFVDLVREYRFSTFLDIGAHYGYYSAIYQELMPHCPILCIEPNPITRQMTLRENLIGKRIEICEFAITNGSRPYVNFDMSISNTGGSKVENFGHIQVKAVKLSDLLLQDIDFAKVDVEGNEHEIIPDLCAISRLKHLIIEISPCFSQQNAQSSVDQLTTAGFKLFDLGITESGTYPIYPVLPEPITAKRILQHRQRNIYAVRS